MAFHKGTGWRCTYTGPPSIAQVASSIFTILYTVVIELYFTMVADGALDIWTPHEQEKSKGRAWEAKASRIRRLQCELGLIVCKDAKRKQQIAWAGCNRIGLLNTQLGQHTAFLSVQCQRNAIVLFCSPKMLLSCIIANGTKADTLLSCWCFQAAEDGMVLVKGCVFCLAQKLL